jgi:uncharacterized membrane protein SpoIIM required for sporulation
MKETSFIEQNKAKWARFEKLYASGEEDPEQLADLYMELTNDLSYAQTFYKRRTVRVYLNQLSQKIFSGVHKHKREPLKKFLDVWRISLPLEIYRSRKNLLFAFICFTLYAAIGAFSTNVDHNFPRMILGDGYVEMTLENIKKGNPLKVYESEDQMGMFLMITTNNLKVSFLTFFAGFFLTIGTQILLFSNGVMIGSFQYFFHLKGLLLTSFLGIWIHGAFEISSIVIAGGAGITAGSGLLFPGTYTRSQSLRLSAKRGMKLMLSLVPFIIMAGFLESYVTHNYNLLPDWSKWALILFSFAVILFIYMLYPLLVARKYPELVDRETVTERKEVSEIVMYKIRGIGELCTVAVQFYMKHFIAFMSLILKWVLPVALVLIAMQDFLHTEWLKITYWFDWSAQLNIMTGGVLGSWTDIVVSLLWMFLISVTFCAAFFVMNQQLESEVSPFSAFLKKKVLFVMISLLIPLSVILYLPWQFHVFSVFLIPFTLYMAPSAALYRGASKTERMSKGFRYSAGSYGKLFLLLFVLGFFLFLFLQPLGFVFSIHETNEAPLMRDLLDVLVDFVTRSVVWITDDALVVGNIIRQLVYLSVLMLLIPFIAFIFGFGFLSEVEKREVTSLKKAFEKFGATAKNKEEQPE